MKYIKISISVLIILLSIKVIFNNLMLYSIMHPEYFQYSDTSGSLTFWLILILNILLPIVLLVMVFIHWNGKSFFSKYTIFSIVFCAFILLQLLHISIRDNLHIEFITHGILETLRSVRILSSGLFLFFLVFFVIEKIKKKGRGSG